MTEKHDSIQRKNTRWVAVLCTLILTTYAAAQDNTDGYLPLDFYAGTVTLSGKQWRFMPCVVEDEGRAWTAQWLREEDKKLAEQLTAAGRFRPQSHGRPDFWLQVVAEVNSRQNSVRIHEVVSYRENESCRLNDYLDALFSQ